MFLFFFWPPSWKIHGSKATGNGRFRHGDGQPGHCEADSHLREPAWQGQSSSCWVGCWVLWVRYALDTIVLFGRRFKATLVSLRTGTGYSLWISVVQSPYCIPTHHCWLAMKHSEDTTKWTSEDSCRTPDQDGCSFDLFVYAFARGISLFKNQRLNQSWGR